MKPLVSHLESRPSVIRFLFLANCIAAICYFVFFPDLYTSDLWLLTLGTYIVTVGFGISVTYHRYLAHRSFQLNRIFEIIFSTLAAITGAGSSIGWVLVHRTHHQHSDSRLDPHSPVFLSPTDILLGKYQTEGLKGILVRDLFKDRFHVFLHSYYLLILLCWILLLLAIGVSELVFIWVIPFILMKLQGVVSGVLSHKKGYRTHNTPDRSSQNWIVSALIFGEGWHNSHHADPKKWRFGETFWEIDLGATFVWIVSGFKVKPYRPRI